MFAEVRTAIPPSLPAATLRDVCREAGVSLATADRVLNGRPGVRTATIERVLAATERLGYRANLFASRLARGGTIRLAFVLPRGGNPFMTMLAEQVGRLAEHFAVQRVSVRLVQADAFDARAQAAALDRLEGEADGVAVVALDQAAVREAIGRLDAAGLPVVTLVSDAPGTKRAQYVGIDNLAAGRTAGTMLGRFATRRSGTVGVVLGSASLRDHADRLRGFEAVLASERPALRVLPPLAGQDDDAASGAAAARLLAEHADLAGLYAAGAGTAGIARALDAAGRGGEVVLIGHELTEASRPWLERGTIDALIHQDPGHEVRSAARLLLARLTGEPVLPDQERIRIEIFLRDNIP